MIAKENECTNNLFIVKSGDIFVWIKITRTSIKKHQRILEKFSKTNEKFIYSNGKSLKGYIIFNELFSNVLTNTKSMMNHNYFSYNVQLLYSCNNI